MSSSARATSGFVLLGLAVFLDSGTARAQDWDLGPVPAVVVECLAEAEGAGSLATDPGLDGSWRQFRRDGKLAGRSPLIGNLTCPEWLWTIDLGARRHWHSVTPAIGNSQLELPTSGEIGNHFQLRLDFEIADDLIDLDGDGTTRVSPGGGGVHKIGDLLPAVPGLERVMCYPDIGDLDRCYLHRWSNGDWQEVWNVDLAYFEANAGGSRPIVADFDADGAPEVAVISWYQVHLVDLATGAYEQSGEFLDPATPEPVTGRGYGWFGGVDLDQQPGDEFVILGDFEHFVSVIGWSNGQLTRLWRYEIQPGVYETFVRHHTGVNPAADVDGDGIREIVTSIFNASGDDRWHIVVFDGMTGDIELDIPGAYLSGLGDVDGDDVADMLITETDGGGLPDYGGTSVQTFEGGVLEELWSSTTEAFELYDSPAFPLNVNPATTHGRRSAFLRDDWNGQPVFITRSRSGNGPNVELHVRQWSQGAIAKIASITGPRLSVEAMAASTPERGFLVQSVTEQAIEGPLQFSNASGVLELTGRMTNGDGAKVASRTLLTSTVVNSSSPGQPAQVITQGYDQTLRAFEIDVDSPREVWRTEGRGWTHGDYGRAVASINGFGSILLADTQGTGDLTTIAATKSSDGAGVIRNVDSSGNLVWQRTLPTDGAAPLWNDAGITHWMAGNFTSQAYEDILVSVRRQTQHNHELYLLDGQLGTQLWRITDGYRINCEGTVDGPGSSLMPIFDWDGDGLDDMLESVEVSFSAYSGIDGSQLVERTTAVDAICPGNPIFPETVSTSPMLAVADLLDNGAEQILYGKNVVTMAVLEFNGDAAWYTPFNGGMWFQTMQGIADLDGDGAVEIIAAAHCTTPGAEVRVYEGATGALRWTLPMPSSCDWPNPKALVSGDLDGNGADEVYILQANVLHALAERDGSGLWLWRATIGEDGAEFGEPVIADVGGNGRPQILINSPFGHLYGLGNRGRFRDAGLGYWAFEFIETLARAGITGGCGRDQDDDPLYCPENAVTRAQMAVFLERGMRGSAFVPPPATGSVFADVASTDFAAGFIEQLSADGITGGCGGGNFCPTNDVTRAQMAVFLLRAVLGPGYVPPPASGVFTDVPPGSFAADWIEALAAEGISSGCGNGDFCPNDAVTRAQMAVFLVRAFGL